MLTLDVGAGGAVVAEMGVNHGLDSGQVLLGWCGSEPAPVADSSGGCGLTRGSVVEAEVRIWVPLIETPWGPVGGLWAIGRHTEPIDLYRSLG